MNRKSFALMLAAALSAPACATQSAMPLPPAPIAAVAPEEVVDAFHAALKAGNRAAALALLADDVLILEGGGAERSKAEYAAHHLDADAAFTKAVPNVQTKRTVATGADFAWVATEGQTKGEFRGRAIDKVSAETMVLKRAGTGWTIAHIHWSSADPH